MAERIFVTGASGYIGSVVVEKLRAAGYEVMGLARSDEAARRVKSLGAQVCRGDLREPGRIAEYARRADAVVYLARAAGPGAGEVDAAAVAAMLDAMAGSENGFVYTSGGWVMGETRGRVAGEMWPAKPAAIVAWRPAVERMVLEASLRNVRGVVIRPVTVYGRGGGTVGRMVRGELPLVGDGENHWSFVHVDDLADLYVLALERSPAAEMYLAADGPAFQWKDVAAAAGVEKRLTIEEARAEMGLLADALVLDQKIGSTKAGRFLAWKPARPTVMEELQRGQYARAAC